MGLNFIILSWGGSCVDGMPRLLLEGACGIFKDLQQTRESALAGSGRNISSALSGVVQRSGAVGHLLYFWIILCNIF